MEHLIPTDALCEKEKIKIITHDDHYAKMMEKRSFEMRVNVSMVFLSLVRLIRLNRI